MRAYKVIRAADRWTDRVIIIIFLLIALIGLYVSLDAAYIFKHSSADAVSGFKPEVINSKTMGEISEDMVAWITIDDTTIDYPIMQGKTNNEYLNKDVYGKYALAGSIFLDSRNASDFSDPYSLIYGHHMQDGYMFGALDSFMDETYFDDHRTGTLFVGDEEYKINLFAFLRCDANVKEVFQPGETEGPQDYAKRNASIYRDHGEGNWIALSTCKSPESTERTIVFGEIISKD